MQLVRTRIAAAALAALFAGVVPGYAAGTAPATTAPAAQAAPAATPAAPTPAPAPAPAPAPPPTWGLLARGGWFGVPDTVAGAIFEQHPDITGWIAGAELRWYGKGGPRGVSSFGLAYDHGYASADGIWQADKSDRPVQGNGHAAIDAITATAYWNILPSWPIHPYLGLGFGVAHIDGEYVDDEGTKITAKGWIPSLHVPVGLALELGEHAQLLAEARFIDGFAAGGALQLRF